MTIKQVTHNGLKRWRVTFTVAGRTRRKFFTAKETAETFAAAAKREHAQYGTEWLSLGGPERAALVQAERRAKGGGYTLAEACDALERMRGTSDTTMERLVKDCLTDKRGRSLRPESVRLLGVTLAQFNLRHGQRLAREIQPGDVAEFISNPKWGPWRRRGAHTDLMTLFSWGVRRGLIPDNPAARVDRPIMDAPAPKIFTPEKCRETLAMCRTRWPELEPWLLLSLWAGVRTAEIARLTWRDVRIVEGIIVIGSHAAKTRQRRIITMRPGLGIALKAAKDKYLIYESRHQPIYREFHAAARDWSRDVLRHSYVSYELAASQDIQATALQAGHSPAVLFRHYRALVTQSQAGEFWDIITAL